MPKQARPVKYQVTLTVQGVLRRPGVKDVRFEIPVDTAWSRRTREKCIREIIEAVYPQGFVIGTPVDDVEKTLLSFAETLIERLSSAW